MNLLEAGILKRLDKVSDHTNNDPRVIQAGKEFYIFHDKLKGIDENLSHELEEIVNNYVAVSEAAAYKFGISDGFNIREQVADLTNIKGVVENV